MNIEYNLTRRDLFIVALYTYFFYGKRVFAFLAAVVLLVYSQIYLLPDYPYYFVCRALGPVAIFLITLLTIHAVFYSLVNLDGVYGLNTMTLTEEGLHKETHFNRHFNTWQCIRKIQRIPGYILIQNSHLTFYTIPVRSFQDAAQLEVFYDKAVALWKEHHGR